MKTINGLLKHLDKLSKDASKGEEKDKHGEAFLSVVSGKYYGPELISYLVSQPP